MSNKTVDDLIGTLSWGVKCKRSESEPLGNLAPCFTAKLIENIRKRPKTLTQFTQTTQSTQAFYKSGSLSK